MRKILNANFLLVLFFIILLNSSCKKDDFRYPYVTINANIGIFSDLGDLEAGGIKVFPKDKFGGISGLIVYRDYDDNYYVFDTACSHDYYDNCGVTKDITNSFPTVVCPCCGSTFFIDSDGGIITKGPAKYPLKEYPAFVNGSILIVNY